MKKRIQQNKVDANNKDASFLCRQPGDYKVAL
jgi:hypothetical protein